MRINDFTDESGRIFAFEVEMPLFGRRGLVWRICKIPGVRILRRPLILSGFREDKFCEFEIGGHLFECSEAFGDNSHYWIGAKDRQHHPEILNIRKNLARRF